MDFKKALSFKVQNAKSLSKKCSVERAMSILEEMEENHPASSEKESNDESTITSKSSSVILMFLKFKIQASRKYFSLADIPQSYTVFDAVKIESSFQTSASDQEFCLEHASFYYQFPPIGFDVAINTAKLNDTL